MGLAAPIRMGPTLIPPAVIRALGDIDQASFVAGITVVVAGEKIAVGIESQFLRIPQTDSEFLKLGSVRPATEYRKFQENRATCASTEC